MEDPAQQVRQDLREFITIDDQIRALQTQIRQLRERKNDIGGRVLAFMRGNQLDNFVIEGGGGTIARQERTVRQRPNKTVVRTQIALLLADQPQRMAEVLRTIEGIPEPGQEDTGTMTTRELLTRRIPRTQHINLGQ
jgi:hypothetical protein